MATVAVAVILVPWDAAAAPWSDLATDQITAFTSDQVAAVEAYVADVLVVLENIQTNYTLVTDVRGRFRAKLPPGTYSSTRYICPWCSPISKTWTMLGC